MRRARLILVVLGAMTLAWVVMPCSASADGLLPQSIVIPQHVLTELLHAVPAEHSEETLVREPEADEAVDGDASNGEEPASRRVDIAPSMENMIRLLGPGVDLGGRDTRRDGGLCVQLRPKGSGAVFRAVLRF